MKIKPEEISQVIKSEIESFEKAVKVEEVGTVIAVGDGIARVHGVEKAMFGELLEFPHNVMGIILNDHGGPAIGDSLEDQRIKGRLAQPWAKIPAGIRAEVMPGFRAFGRQLQLRRRNQRNTRHRSREKADAILRPQRPDIRTNLSPVPQRA